MPERARAGLYLLKQYGFSDKFLDWLYWNSDRDHIIEHAFSASLETVGRVPCTKKDQLIQRWEDFDEFVRQNKDSLVDELNDSNMRILFKYDDNELNHFIPKSKRPMFFYLKGKLGLLSRDNRFVAMVGTRKLSPAFVESARALVDQYVHNNFVIVSGLAEGTDTVVHSRALKDRGKTLAILPTNFEHIYPSQNRQLAEEIFRSGLAMTSVGPLQNTFKSTFLERNQYVASISDEVVVIETSLHSGTMNTIHNAIKLGKTVRFLTQPIPEVNVYLTNIGAQQM